MSLFLLSALLHAYVGMRVVAALPGAWAPAAFILLLLAGAVCTPLGLVGRRYARQPLADRLTWVGLVFMGLLSSMAVLAVVRDAVLLVLWVAEAVGVTGMAPQRFTQATAMAVPVLGALFTLWGLANARRTARTVTVEVPITGLPPALQGFTIAQISDIHVGPTIKGPYLQAIVDSVNRMAPDLVAITGDLVDGSVTELGAHVAPLADLRARHGSFFVTGNHEYYSGAAAWVAELQRLGIPTLMNRHVVLIHGDAHLVLAGVADFSAHHFDPRERSDPQAAMHGAPASAAVRVLLAHQPRSASAAAAAGFDLQLSGHTHGGQFLPWNFLVRLQQPFTAGLHRLDRLWVYVSRGTGYWGPPKRLGAPSEITRIRLVAA